MVLTENSDTIRKFYGDEKLGSMSVMFATGQKWQCAVIDDDEMASIPQPV